MQTTVEKDNELLQATFKGNESLLKLLRSLFFGWSVSDADKQLIKDTLRVRIYEKPLDVGFIPSSVMTLRSVLSQTFGFKYQKRSWWVQVSNRFIKFLTQEIKH